MPSIVEDVDYHDLVISPGDQDSPSLNQVLLTKRYAPLVDRRCDLFDGPETWARNWRCGNMELGHKGH